MGRSQCFAREPKALYGEGVGTEFWSARFEALVDPLSVPWGESGPPTLLGVRVSVLTLGLHSARAANLGLGAYPNME